MKKALEHWLNVVWYESHFAAALLVPLSFIFQTIIRFRRFLYHIGVFKTQTLPVPVIVVGNISVGGTGKTPLIIWLVRFLKQAGFKPGVISRGYGGSAREWPQWVDAESDPKIIGDEALMLARQCLCPLAVGPVRVESAQLIIENRDCDIILSDDGLQHYALGRDIEIAVIDGVRRFGNGYCLPAGPLREPISRLQQVDLIICNDGDALENEYSMRVVGNIAKNLVNCEQRKLQDFKDQYCHALAGIGNPDRFFNLLKRAGLKCREHVFPDHFFYQQKDINFIDDLPVLMTEKDAVKCIPFACEKHWYVPIQSILQPDFSRHLLQLLKKTRKTV